MAVKKKKQKKNYMKWLVENAVKIKCCYCDARETCPYRDAKERTERMGIVTKCVNTPNKKPKKKPKKRRKHLRKNNK